MKVLSTFQAVENLLGEIKKRIAEDGLFYMNSRSKNAQTLANLGLTAQEQKEIIDSLKPEDYCGGHLMINTNGSMLLFLGRLLMVLNCI